METAICRMTTLSSSITVSVVRGWPRIGESALVRITGRKSQDPPRYAELGQDAGMLNDGRYVWNCDRACVDPKRPSATV